MKILVISDTHLKNKYLKRITDKYPDMDLYLHCGDSSLSHDDPLLEKYYTVNGNHDKKGMFPEKIIFMAKHYQCMICHGNLFNIYAGNDQLLNYMQKNDIDIVFHGHTHVPSCTIFNNKYIINPGSVMMNRGSYGFGTYAIVQITKNSLQINYYNSLTDEECSKKVLEDGKVMLEEFKKYCL